MDATSEEPSLPQATQVARPPDPISYQSDIQSYSESETNSDMHISCPSEVHQPTEDIVDEIEASAHEYDSIHDDGADELDQSSTSRGRSSRLDENVRVPVPSTRDIVHEFTSNGLLG